MLHKLEPIGSLCDAEAANDASNLGLGRLASFLSANWASRCGEKAGASDVLP
jgi:hypothetical protein